MQVHNLFIWLISPLFLAYNPPVEEIVSRMETALRRSDPVILKVVRETPDASLRSELQIKIPADSVQDSAADPAALFPFSSLTLPAEELPGLLPSLYDGNASVRLARFQGFICFVLEGRTERLWLRKTDYIPLKVELLPAFGGWTTSVYLDLINVSKKAVYPSRTETLQNGTLVMVERLIPAGAGTVQP